MKEIIDRAVGLGLAKKEMMQIVFENVPSGGIVDIELRTTDYDYIAYFMQFDLDSYSWRADLDFQNFSFEGDLDESIILLWGLDLGLAWITKDYPAKLRFTNISANTLNGYVNIHLAKILNKNDFIKMLKEAGIYAYRK